ncbi:PREDICTED: uncharacterized protein LOC107337267 isoform X2 [Acropora digitifera]|uniref:uncharacterized protein LOC107337267 isoform X2 n=1 Tax=Acropora digitifera TaxID=70779 RepID=UPI00077A3150|nr:PREDICTED: uncharacterized protein LOC107337267 isoform X2 [Acropora digitifera]
MLFHKHLGFSVVKQSKIMSKRFHLTLWLFLVCGSAAFSQNCPTEAVRIKCDAAAQERIQSIDWEVFVSPSWLPLSTCRTRGSLECIVMAAKPPGIEVLNVENDTLVIRRTSLRASFQDMKFKCIVRQNTGTVPLLGTLVPVDLSVECIWSHVDAVVNLTNHFMKILPRKTVDKVVLFDSSKVNAIRIGVCRLQLHLGCQCTLSKRIKRSALAYRLQERQHSILFSPVRDSDEGLGMRVQVHFTDNSRRNLTLRIRLKPKEAKTTSSLPTSTQAKKTGNNIHEKMDSKNPQVAIKLATEKGVGKSTEDGTDSKRGQNTAKLHRTRELVAQILRMSQELNHLVNAAGNVSSAVKTN